MKYENAVKLLKNIQLTDIEIRQISILEKYIDEEIYFNFNGGEVVISYEIASFGISPDGENLHLRKVRSNKMMKMLEEQYINAGWDVTSDGYNWILSGADKK